VRPIAACLLAVAPAATIPGRRIYRWFIGIRALTFAQGADEAGIPLEVMRDLGLCKMLSTLP